MAYKNDPRWIIAKFDGKDQRGNPVKKGQQVLFFPQARVIYTGEEATQAWAEFQASAQDEALYNGGTY